MVRKMSDSYEKGLELEKLVAEIFRAKGYYVKHNVKLIGRSGVEHQIDVYAEYKAPLHTSKIIVECKAYDKPIDKDVVMKLIHEVDDLGVDRGILVTTSYFTPDTISTAKGYNIDLWDGAKLRELLEQMEIRTIEVPPSNVFHVELHISDKEAIKIIDKTIRRALFGRIGNISRSSVIFYPYYELDITAKIYEVKGLIRKKVEEKLVSSKILIDAITGDLCDYDYDGRGVIVSIVRIPTLSSEEERVLQILLTYGPLTVSALASLINCSTYKARRILQGLVAKGIATTYRSRQIFYEPTIEDLNPSQLRTISKYVDLKDGEPKEGIKISPTLSLEDIERFIRAIWNGSIKSYITVFYPYYACEITENGKKYIRAVDMITGTVDDRISMILTDLYEQIYGQG